MNAPMEKVLQANHNLATMWKKRRLQRDIEQNLLEEAFALSMAEEYRMQARRCEAERAKMQEELAAL